MVTPGISMPGVFFIFNFIPKKNYTMETFTYRIYQDNQIRKEFKNQSNDINVFGWMLRNQHNSMHYALKYGGWKIEVLNEQTGEVKKY